MKNALSWDVTPCGSCKSRRFEGTTCFACLLLLKFLARRFIPPGRWRRQNILDNSILPGAESLECLRMSELEYVASSSCRFGGACRQDSVCHHTRGTEHLHGCCMSHSPCWYRPAATARRPQAYCEPSAVPPSSAHLTKWRRAGWQSDNAPVYSGGAWFESSCCSDSFSCFVNTPSQVLGGAATSFQIPPNSFRISRLTH
jgi:hypothetical protein